jgi:integration host factor alpha subunit
VTAPKSTSATKADLATAVYDALQVSKRDAAVVVDTVFEAMVEALAQGRDLKIAGFGTFSLRRHPARKGRNPKTGEAVPIPARTVVLYRPSAAVKDGVADVDATDGKK